MVNGPLSSSNGSPQPLERLNVYDGLMMNAARWDLSQVYMRKRQNIHFQAVHQAGIVYGLGVKVIEAPTWAKRNIRAQDAQRNETRWLEIQPGLAIDAVGNPIIVSQGNERDRTFRIAISPPTSGRLTVYIVARYVEPTSNGNGPGRGHGNGNTGSSSVQAGEDSSGELPHTLIEQFRFDQKTTPPDKSEVELCRVQLLPGTLQLKMPADILTPDVGELDLTHRRAVQAKPQAVVRVGVMGRLPQSTRDQFQSLRQAMATLSPQLSITLASTAVQPDHADVSQHYDLLYVAGQHLQPLVQKYSQWLENVVNSGVMVMVETPSATPPNFSPRFHQLFPQFTPWVDCPPSHLSKTQPFLFTQLPDIGEQRINVAIAPGLLWVGGGLSKAWGIYQSLPRHDIRTAHELGINLMHYVWQQQHLRQLTHW